ncbi:hydroxymethylbilane synthase [Desulfitispora alkaliphila]|uniref:hydroxymethylbilane synthase n=1 Tax=Desulfitispora alkaliphila TaxID=622674 RepID=UPI003D1CF212
MSKKVIIGTRDSNLAMWQTKWVKKKLEEAHPHLDIEVKPIKTQGDKILDVALSKIGDKGLFTKELEVAMLDNTIDFAVHSMKDLPTVLPDGLVVSAITERHDPRDVVISKTGVKLKDLPEGAVIGTSSLRRQSQINNQRPDFKIKDIRGNLNTRMRKLEEGNYDAIILAAAGVERLDWASKITEKLDIDKFLPAVGQGALGIEARAGDDFISEVVSVLNDRDTSLAVRAERAMLKTLEGGCQIPIGAHAYIDNDQIVLSGFVGSVDGKELIRESKRGPVASPEELGIALAESLIASGALDILRQIRN